MVGFLTLSVLVVPRLAVGLENAQDPQTVAMAAGGGKCPLPDPKLGVPLLLLAKPGAWFFCSSTRASIRKQRRPWGQDWVTAMTQVTPEKASESLCSVT